MHSKLKVGMTSLHSKIAVSNHNMPSQPMPAVRKFADGGAVTTRSDDEIGDTNPRTGKVDPGSYDRRMAQGEKNLQALKDAFNKFTGDKATTTVKENESNMSSDSMDSTYYKGNKSSDTTKPVEMKTETEAEPSYMKGVRDTLTKPKAEPTMTMPVTEEPAVVKTAKPTVAKSSTRSAASNSVDASKDVSAKPARSSSSANRMSAVGQSQKDIEARILANKGLAGNEAMKREIEQDSKTDTGDETKRLRDRTSTFVPGFGQIDKDGKIIPNVRGGRMASQVYGAKEDSFMESAEKRYLKSRIDAGNLTAMERAQAKRAGLI
jgi:hypothetical protein